MALGGPAEPLRAVQARNAAPPYRPLNLAAARSTVWPRLMALLLFATADDDSFWNMGKRGVFTMLALLSPIVGDSSSRHHYRSTEHEEQGCRRGQRSRRSVDGKT